MKLQRFDGGLVTRVAPQFLGIEQAADLENIDFSKMELRPLAQGVSESTTSVGTLFSYYYDANASWVDSTTVLDFVEYQGNAYYSDRTNEPKVFDGTTTANLGIANPTTKPTLAASAGSRESFDAEVPADIHISNEAGGDLPDGELVYRIYGWANAFAITGAQVQFLSTALEVKVDGKATTEVNKSNTTADFQPNPGNVDPTKDYNSSQAYYDPEALEFTYPDGGGTISVATPGDLSRQVRFSNFVDTSASLGTRGFIVYRWYRNQWLVVGVTTDGSDIVDNTYELTDTILQPALDQDAEAPFYGTYQYVYTYYDSATGTESGPSPVSDEFYTIGANGIDVTVVESADSRADSIRLYRVGGNIAEFTLVDTFTSSVTLTDTKLNKDVEGTLLATEDYLPAPAGLKYLTQSYAILFGALGSTLRFTPIGVPYAWPAEFSLEFYQDITGIAPVANGVLVFTKYETHIVTGNGPDTFSKQLLRGDLGCISQDSVQKIKSGLAIWASDSGLCVSNGGSTQIITQPVLGKLDLSGTVNSAVADEVYYLYDGSKILVYDYRFADRFQYINIANVDSLTFKDGNLYYISGEQRYQAFSSSNLLSFKYKSPRLTEGSLTETKTYKKFYFSHGSDIIIRIYIDDQLVFSTTTSSEGVTTYQVPQDKQRGYFVQFEVEGNTYLNEIWYQAEGRFND